MSALPDPGTQGAWRLPEKAKEKLLKAMAEILDQPLRSSLTFEEFLDWMDEDTHAEWVGGDVIMTSPASLDHQEMAIFLVRVMRTYSEWHSLGTVLVAPFLMKVGESGREPDVLFVAREHQDRIKKTFLDGPADLVIEVISPESAGRDRGDKYFEYEQAGVGEYWLIDPRTNRAEFYQLRDGGYQLVAPDAEGIYHSAVMPGLWLRVSWLWEDPLPEVEDVLLEIGGAGYARSLMERLRRKGYSTEG